MAHEWRVAVRWVIVLMPSGRTWTSADARTAEVLREQLALGLQQPGAGGRPVVMWEMRDEQGQLLRGHSRRTTSTCSWRSSRL